MKKTAPDYQGLPMAATKLGVLFVDGRQWLLDIEQLHPDRLEDVLEGLRALFHNELQIARCVRAAMDPRHWRFRCHMSEIEIALRRLQLHGALVEVPPKDA